VCALVADAVRAGGADHRVAEFRGSDMTAIARQATELPTFCFADWQDTVRTREGEGVLPAVGPGDAAQVQYTSGFPKGALLHHRGLVTNARFSIDLTQLPDGGVPTMLNHPDFDRFKATTAGRPLPRMELAIRDPLTSEVVPVGQQGEICVRGYQTMLGYFDMPDRTRETVDADGWLRTGDLGILDARAT
jgi:long-subunit acyl-CoA synthetase (AMP-forming)